MLRTLPLPLPTPARAERTARGGSRNRRRELNNSDRENIAFLSQRPYKVSWKVDGTRYMVHDAD